MKYLMVTKWDNIFTQKGELQTDYMTKYVKIDTSVENIETIFINTKSKTIYSGVFIKTVTINQDKIIFRVMVQNQLAYSDKYNNQKSGWFVINDNEYNQYLNSDLVAHNQMVYITVANSLKISRSINPDKFDELTGDIYKNKISFFNKKFEVNNLLAIKEFYSHPEKFIKELYSKVENKDTFKLVYEGIQPAYHTNMYCEQLNKDYENFEIPEFIIAKGKEAVKVFRAWFEENKNEKLEIFVMRLHARFGITTNPAAIKFENSGHTLHHNLGLNEIEKIIDDLLAEANNYISKNETNKRIITKYGRIAFTYKKQVPKDKAFKDDEIYTILKEFDEQYKQPIYKHLIEYYKIKLNPDLAFKGQLLDLIGFKQCGACKGKN